MDKYFIPADVPSKKHKEYLKNMQCITHGTDRLFLFAGDHKMEHLNDDFENPAASPEAQDPHHFFTIAQKAPIGAFAAQLGLIARYAPHDKKIPYIIKLNGKTNTHPDHQDPESAPLYTVDDVLTLKKETGLNVAGIGLTIYVGSEYETDMLNFTAQSLFHAHQEGLVTIVWIYARGAGIADATDPELTAGLAGLGTQLGADFIKIKPPHDTHAMGSAEHLKTIVAAAGNSKVICSGGQEEEPQDFLRTLYDQLHVGGTAGCAVGRNLFQRSTEDAIALARAIAALVYDNASLEKALDVIKNKTVAS
jgi:DhnA family fructose-bisphosphate aldolase class Ia